ncbi:MAG: flagellar M-ring protein FliF [Planctomycetes bacterium RBG_13_62_9]|nr:MAG: flagellar M-ring protein FliF [Planctomycetes bacterium RBG_13_62_9]
MEFLHRIVLIWQKISLVQRALLTAVLLTVAIVGAVLIYWARLPDMRMLYQDLQPAEASKITERVAEKGIPYELRDGGATIYVPRQHVYQLRLDLAKEGLPVNEQNGYKLFDDEKIGVSPFVQNVNLKRALEDELSKSIQFLDGVAYARVHIVNPEQSLFVSEQEQTTASVVLRLKPGYQLSGANIAAITHLVSGGVKGLKSENVTVIDSEGHLLSGSADPALATGATTAHDYKERVEQGLARKAEDMLTTVLGPGRATVRVSAVIDMNSVNTITETYDPTSKVVTKEEITNNSTTDAGSSGQKTAAGTTKKDETTMTEYQVGKTVKQQTILPGEIKSLSVAAFVDLSTDANDTGAGGQPALIMQVTEVEQIIRMALGLKESDSLKVVNAKFHQAAKAPVEEPADWSRYIAIARHLSLGIMAVCALVVLRMFSRARSKTTSRAQGQLPEGAGPSGLLPPGELSAEPVLLRQQIAQALRHNPDQVRQMFLRWIEEKE